MCVCIWRPYIDTECFPAWLSTLFIESGLSLNPVLMVLLDWLVSKFQGAACLCLSYSCEHWGCRHNATPALASFLFSTSPLPPPPPPLLFFCFFFLNMGSGNPNWVLISAFWVIHIIGKQILSLYSRIQRWTFILHLLQNAGFFSFPISKMVMSVTWEVGEVGPKDQEQDATLPVQMSLFWGLRPTWAWSLWGKMI